MRAITRITNGMAVLCLVSCGPSPKTEEIVVEEIRAIPELAMAAYGMGVRDPKPGQSPGQVHILGIKAAEMSAARNLGELANLGSVNFRATDDVLERSRNFLLVGADHHDVLDSGERVWSLAVAPAPNVWIYHHYLSHIIRLEQRLRAGDRIDPIHEMALRGPGPGLLGGADGDTLASALVQLEAQRNRKAVTMKELGDVARALQMDREALLEDL